MFEPRPYKPDDLNAICQFLSRHGQMHPGDFVWRTLRNTRYQAERDVWVWERHGQIAGLCWQQRDFFELELADLPEAERFGLFRDISAHAEAHSKITCEKSRKIITTTLEGNLQRRAWLQQLGYEHNGSVMHFNRIELNQTISEPVVPQGFVLRHVEGSDLKERVEIHRRVWYRSRFSRNALLNLRASWLYQPELDLVVVSSEGRFVSYAIVWYDPDRKVGEFEPVGTRKAFRGLGLGKAILLEGFRRLQQLGAERAIVYCKPETFGFYQSAGFETVDWWLDYSKIL